MDSVINKIVKLLMKFKIEKFSGVINIKFILNQGGIRDLNATTEKQIKL